MRLRKLAFAVVAAGLCCPASAQLRENDPKFWITMADAPFEGASDTAIGILTFDLSISPAGSVDHCRVAFATGPVPNPAALCALIEQRAKYRVAGDKSGKGTKVSDTITYRCVRRACAVGSDFGGAAPFNPGSWVTQEDYPPESLKSGQQGRAELSFDITSNGRIANCVVTSGTGFPDLDRTTCRLFEARARLKPPRDENGHPSATKGKAAYLWALQRTN
jgi:TonB family protein